MKIVILCVTGLTSIWLRLTNRGSHSPGSDLVNKSVSCSEENFDLDKRNLFCLHGWTRINGACFKYISTLMTWARAEINCQSMDAHLASVQDIKEYVEIQNLTAPYGYMETWIGGSNAQEDNFWFWTDGEKFAYTNWCSGQPSNYQGLQHCLSMNYSAKRCWDDVGSSDAAAPLFITLSGTDRDSGELVLQCESKGWYPEPEVSCCCFFTWNHFSRIDESSSGLVLQCESKGWYPEPEVLWLDGEGHVLSAGPTETVRGPDDLYTVSSRVTVDKRHGNTFTCRVQQTIINQTRETHIHVSNGFYKVQSSFSAPTLVLAVSLALCIMLILLLVFFLWKNKNMIMSKKNQRHETREGKRMNFSQDDKAEVEFLTNVQKDRKQCRRRQAAATCFSSFVWPFVSKQRFHLEKQEKEEAQSRVQILNNELKTKRLELEGNLKETNHRLQEEKQKREKPEEEVESLKNHLDEHEEEGTEEKDKKTLNTGSENKTKEVLSPGRVTDVGIKDEIQGSHCNGSNIKCRNFRGRMGQTRPIRAKTLNKTQLLLVMGLMCCGKRPVNGNVTQIVNKRKDDTESEGSTFISPQERVLYSSVCYRSVKVETLH
ncbi:hypothetical protein Q5P01_002878 [Channa striata]|uniref:Ig-like domain-containing protein n=1 Tax=Channa striata TaxID=64152 RepID=A0AA88TED4_CHASR|nr:hypothetical protein Q5P01_002878 [Channa striata]